ncbi:MAG: tripartite tricarboxylate transporter substrate binding protein [Pseudomonadota bacterium]
MMSRVVAVLAAAGLMSAVLTQGALAQADYPSKPVTLIVPYPAGGGSDTMARTVAEKLGETLGVRIIIENSGSGGGTVGTRTAAKAAPDGYTLLLGHTGTISINPTLYTNPGYDPDKDFVPMGTIARIQLALVTHPTFPAKSVKEFIDMAKKSPGTIAMGASAIGTGSYMSAQLFTSMTGVNVNIISYRGLAPFLTDILGGHVPVGFSVIPPAFANIKSGNLKPLAVSSANRLVSMPDVPTVAEAGVPGFESSVIYGIFAPAGTNADIVAKVNKALQTAMKSKELYEQVVNEGGEPLFLSPQEYKKQLAEDANKWSSLIKKLNLKIEN